MSPRRISTRKCAFCKRTIKLKEFCHSIKFTYTEFKTKEDMYIRKSVICADCAFEVSEFIRGRWKDETASQIYRGKLIL